MERVLRGLLRIAAGAWPHGETCEIHEPGTAPGVAHGLAPAIAVSSPYRCAAGPPAGCGWRRAGLWGGFPLLATGWGGPGWTVRRCRLAPAPSRPGAHIVGHATPPGTAAALMASNNSSLVAP